MSSEQAARVSSEAGGPGRYLFDLTVGYTYDRPVRRLQHRLMVVPRPTHGPQALVEWALRVQGAQAEQSVAVDAFGNHVVQLWAPSVETEVEFSLTAVVDQRSRPDGVVLVGAPSVEALWLAPTRLTKADKAIKAAAARLGPPATSALELAERACGWAHRSLHYQFGATNVMTTAAEALAGGRGVCQDFAHLMLAVCRAAGLPARYVSGHLLGEGGSHAWVEAMVAPGTAVAFDPTHDRRAAAGYLTVAVGRDYADVAPTSGTFSGKAMGSLTVRKRLRFEASSPAPASPASLADSCASGG